LALKVNSVLKLNRENRSGDGDIFLTTCMNEYASLFENSQVNGLGQLDKLVGLKDTTLNILVK
jgi:sialic acid synthase SpsE